MVNKLDNQTQLTQLMRHQLKVLTSRLQLFLRHDSSYRLYTNRVKETKIPPNQPKSTSFSRAHLQPTISLL